MNILIIGYGIVGGNMHKIFKEADIHDPGKNYYCEKSRHYDVAFVCVPTPKMNNGQCDTSIVKEAIADHIGHVGVFCIRSTIPPGTTEEFKNYFDFDAIAFSPEYYGETIHANGQDYDFITLGGDKKYCSTVAEAYKEVSHSRLKFNFATGQEAETAKYMENCFLALKVSFCVEFRNICKASDVDYNAVRELWLADPRINRSHTFVYDAHPYYDTKCLNKDIPALIEYAKSIGYTPDIMQACFNANEKHKGK
jgi:UDPglucose 6-dehydrogenase